MKYLALVVARKGSKGIPDKNLRLLNGKPLIQYSFESANSASRLDAVHVSTDDDRIIKLAEDNNVGAFYQRPASLATDKSSVLDVILYHLQWLEENHGVVPENVALFQPTSPIRGEDLVNNCIDAFEKSGKMSLIAVSHCSQHPFETFKVENDKLVYLNPTPMRRQEYPEYYFITGSLYVAKTDYIKANRKLFDEDSAIFVVSHKEAVDIDEESDLELAEFYMNKTIWDRG